MNDQKFSEDELKKMLQELERLKQIESEIDILKDSDDNLLKKAIRVSHYTSSLNDNEKEAFKQLQEEQPHVANLLVNMFHKEDVDRAEIKDALMKDEQAYVSSVHLRLSLVQSAVIKYLSRKSTSQFLREMLIDSVKEGGKG